MERKNNCPVVLVHGILGWGETRPLYGRGPCYWPSTLPSILPIIMVDVGSLSSDHDRACEAFYQLKGGRVDYGEHHSIAAGVKPFD